MSLFDETFPGQTPGPGLKTLSELPTSRKDSAKMDWRARIRPKKGGEDQAYGTKNYKGKTSPVY